MKDVRSIIALCLREFPRPKPERTPEGGGLYLTVNLMLIPYTGGRSFIRIIMLMIPSIMSLTIIPVHSLESMRAPIYSLGNVLLNIPLGRV